MNLAVENTKGEKIARISAGAYILLCCLFLFVLRCEEKEELNNMGIMVNLGTVDEGMNSDNIPTAESQVIQEEQPKDEVVEESEASNELEAVTQDVEAAPVRATQKPSTNPVKTNEPVKDPKPAVVKDPGPQVDENALFNGNNNASQGTGNQAGDQGNPNGNLESDIYGDIVGNGFGGAGDGASLKGRGLLFKPNFSNPTNEFGKVVIRITVNKSGKVTNAELVSLHSTNTNQALVNYAIQEAYKFKFNNVASESGARDGQVGKIIFNFTAQ